MDNNAGSEKWAKKSSGSKMSGRGGGPRGRSNSNGSSFRRFKESNSGKALTAQPPSPTNDNNSDNHISSSSSDLTHGAEVVFANPIDKTYQDILDQIPYVKRCVFEQMLVLPKPGRLTKNDVYASTNFIRSPLRKIMFDDNSMASNVDFSAE